MSITELSHEHKSKDLEVNFTELRERIIHMDKKIDARFEKLESVLLRQGEKLERSQDFFNVENLRLVKLLTLLICTLLPFLRESCYR